MSRVSTSSPLSPRCNELSPPRLELIVWLTKPLVGNAIAVSFVGVFLGPMYPIMISQAGRVLPKYILTPAVGCISALGALGSALRNDGGESSTEPKSPDPDYTRFGMALPRALELLPPELRSSPVPIPCKRCVVIGIHGWFPGAMMRSVLGEVSSLIFQVNGH